MYIDVSDNLYLKGFYLNRKGKRFTEDSFFGSCVYGTAIFDPFLLYPNPYIYEL